MTHITDIETSKHSHYRKASVQRVIDTLARHDGKLFKASSEELQAIADSLPHGTHWFEIVNAGMKRYMEIYGKKSI